MCHEKSYFERPWACAQIKGPGSKGSPRGPWDEIVAHIFLECIVSRNIPAELKGADVKYLYHEDSR